MMKDISITKEIENNINKELNKVIEQVDYEYAKVIADSLNKKSEELLPKPITNVFLPETILDSFKKLYRLNEYEKLIPYDKLYMYDLNIDIEKHNYTTCKDIKKLRTFIKVLLDAKEIYEKEINKLIELVFNREITISNKDTVIVYPKGINHSSVEVDKDVFNDWLIDMVIRDE